MNLPASRSSVVVMMIINKSQSPNFPKILLPHREKYVIENMKANNTQ